MHGENNYPLHKEKSDLDVALPLNCNDHFYLEKLYEYLPELFSRVEPDIVYFQAGVDVLATDKLGKLALSKGGLKQRDEYVISLCHQQQVPLVITMGGGYSQKLADLVEAHCNTFRTAISVYH